MATTLQRGVPALLGVVAIVALAVGALRIGESNLDAAVRDRVASRGRLVLAQREELAHYLDPYQRPAGGLVAFLKPDDAAGQAGLLRSVHDDESSPALLAVLVDPDGHRLRAFPEDATVDVGVLGDAWARARQGQGGVTEAFRRNGEVVTATLWAVGGDTPWGVLVAISTPATATRQAYLESLGSLNAEPGGMFLADANGVAVNAWDRSRIGQTVLAPADSAAAPADGTITITSSRDGTETTTIATRLTDGYTLGFQQETGRLVGDLRDAQHQRDTTLLAVLGAALAGLVLFQTARELAARHAEARVNALLENSQDLVLVVDGRGVLTFVSAAVEALLGDPTGRWLGEPLVTRCHPTDEGRVERLLQDPATGPVLNVRLRASDSTYRWFDVEASDLRSHPEVGGILLTCHEIGERKELEDELSRQATHDRLTGLPNRAQFGHQLEQLISDGRSVRPFALLYLDLDHFKPVNDTLGHDAGDHVLVTVTERMADAVGASARLSRLGGDEFGIVLDGGDAYAATQAAESLLEAARAPISVGATLVHLDASIGIALADPGMELHSAEQLVRAADEAMYRAKTGGRGRFEIAPRDGIAPPEARRRSPGRVAAPGSDAAPAERREASDPVPANPLDRPAFAAGTTRSAGSRRRAVLPALVAGMVVIVIAAIGYRQTLAGQQRAERERQQDAIALATRRVRFSLTIIGPTRLHTVAEQSPWTLDGGPVDEAVAAAWVHAPGAAQDSVGFLLAPDGHVLAQYPAGLPLAVDGNSSTVHDAWQGTPGYIPWVEDADMARSYFVLPIRRDGVVTAMWVFGVSADHGPGQQDLERAGGTQYAHGGWSLLDTNGTIYSSWRRELVGTHFTEATNLLALAPGQARVIEKPGVVQVVTPMVDQGLDRHTAIYLALEVPADEFYGDLQVGQTARDLSLLALVLTAVAGLALVNHRRVQAVRRSEARLDSLVQNAHDVVVVLDRDGRTTFVSSAVHRLLGYAVDDRTGQPLEDLVHPDDRDRLASLVGAAVHNHRSAATDIRLVDADGTTRYYDIDAVDRTDQADVGGVLLTCHDIADRKALQDQLAHQASHDALTGLANRATLTAHLDRLTGDTNAPPFAILFVDLDHFKPVNDTLGHDAGDEVLRIIAHRFSHLVRNGDDEHGGDIVCRLGGDEFAVVLHDATDTVACDTAERLIAAAREPVIVGDHTVQVSATVGISLSHPVHGTPDEALREADMAMYRAKAAGRDTFARADTSPASDGTEPRATPGAG